MPPSIFGNLENSAIFAKEPIIIKTVNYLLMKHNLNEEYLQLLTEEQRDEEMSQWTANEWQQYFCPNGTMTIDEFGKLLHGIIDEEYARLGWK